MSVISQCFIFFDRPKKEEEQEEIIYVKALIFYCIWRLTGNNNQIAFIGENAGVHSKNEECVVVLIFLNTYID